MSGAERIAAERQRQVDSEGYAPEHDDVHKGHQLAAAASVYALPEHLRQSLGVHIAGRTVWSFVQEVWPRGWRRKQRAGLQLYVGKVADWQDRQSELVRAGALCAAEIDRIQRMIDSGAVEHDYRTEPSHAS